MAAGPIEPRWRRGRGADELARWRHEFTLHGVVEVRFNVWRPSDVLGALFVALLVAGLVLTGVGRDEPALVAGLAVLALGLLAAKLWQGAREPPVLRLDHHGITPLVAEPATWDELEAVEVTEKGRARFAVLRLSPSYWDRVDTGDPAATRHLRRHVRHVSTSDEPAVVLFGAPERSGGDLAELVVWARDRVMGSPR